MRYLLYLLWTLVSLLVIVLVGVTLLLTVFNDEVEAKLVEKIELTTNRNIDIQGGFGFRINPQPTFYARDIKMANAEWGSKPWMLEIDSLSASLSIRSLLSGEVVLEKVSAQKPKILVEKNPVLKQTNWQFGSKREPKPFTRLAETLRIQNARIEDARISIDMGPIEHHIKVASITGQTNYFSQAIQIQATAQLHDKPIELDVEVNNLRNMLLREPTTLSFSGRHGPTRIKGHGQIADLFRWQGHDIQLDLSTPSLTDLQPWMSTQLIDTPPLSGAAQFVQPQRWSSAKLNDIKVSSVGLDGETKINGLVKQISNWKGIELSGKSHYPLAAILQWKGLETETDAIIDTDFSLQGNKQDALGFEVLSASLKGEGIAAQGKGKIEHILKANTEGITFDVHADSLDKVGSIIARKWIKTDALDGTLKLRRKEGKLALEAIDIHTFNQRLEVKGSLDDLAKTQQGKFHVVSKLAPEDVRQINELNNKSYPEFEQTQIDAQIHTKRAEVSAPKASLTLISEGLEISASGDIADLKTIDIGDVDVAIQAESIGRINQQFGTKLPDLGKLQATGTVKGSIDNLFNINILGYSMENKHQQFTGAGSVTSLGPDLQAELSIKANIESIDNLPQLLNTETKLSQPLAGVGVATLTAESLKDWSIRDIKVVLQGSNQGVVTGNVLHFPEAPEFALIADMQRLQLGKYDHKLIKTLAPENIRAYIEINKSPTDPYFSLNNIDSQLSLAKGSSLVNIAGNIANANQFSDLSLSLGLTASELSSVPFLSNLPLKPGIRGVASATLSGKPDNLAIRVSSMNIGETDIQGELNVVTPKGGKPRITGELRSANLDVLALMQREKRKRLFSDDPLSLTWLNDIDTDLAFKAKRLNGVFAEITDATVNLTIEDGVLTIPGTYGLVGEGQLEMWLTLVAQQQPYSIISSIRGEGIKPEYLNLFGESELIRDGVVDIDIGLGGGGNSIANFMDNAYGKIQLQLHDSLLKNKNLELFGADLITGILDIINPFSRQADYLPIECGVIHFPVVKGNAVASQGIAIKTDKVTVLGGGAIDLGKEELEILIKPKARKGLGLSAGLVANIAKISGDFAKPKVSIDSSSLLQTSAAIGAAVFSGGWTLLAQGLLDRNKANSDVCEQTLFEPNKALAEQVKEKIQIFGDER